MLIACSIFRQTAMLKSRILKTFEFLMSQFMLVMSEQFTITLQQRFQASAICTQIWQLKNNHELHINCIIYCDNLTKVF